MRIVIIMIEEILMAHFNSLPGNKGLAKYMSALGALFFLALTFMSGAAFAGGCVKTQNECAA